MKNSDKKSYKKRLQSSVNRDTMESNKEPHERERRIDDEVPGTCEEQA